MAEAVRKNLEMIEAVEVAKGFAVDLYSEEEARNIGVEAIAKSEDGDRWLITLGFSRPWDLAERRTRNLFTNEQEIVPTRVYKTFEVDSCSGEVLSVKTASSS